MDHVTGGISVMCVHWRHIHHRRSSLTARYSFYYPERTRAHQQHISSIRNQRLLVPGPRAREETSAHGSLMLRLQALSGGRRGGAVNNHSSPAQRKSSPGSAVLMKHKKTQTCGRKTRHRARPRSVLSSKRPRGGRGGRKRREERREERGSDHETGSPSHTRGT
ncbi:unnamed protein product [Pleuronectes platessa]|uniref:Uncharacterized protein n=1 Tax=Pleuronectes platessa TaxID=8262 RepID=A0A9N7VQJ6_PLEPL|nr:unnamed protein product [Pleuronectes platessa]